ncbi:hypothetical protein Ancab_016655 [Ancistrocladus abbreviatus]
MGFAGLWLGLLAAQASCAILMLYVLFRTEWMVQVERARELTKSPSSSPSIPTPSLPVSLSSPESNMIKQAKKTPNDLKEILCIKEEQVKSAPLETDPLLSSN